MTEHNRSMRDRARVMDAAARSGWHAVMDGKDRMVFTRSGRMVSVNWYPASDEIISAFQGAADGTGVRAIKAVKGKSMLAAIAAVLRG